MVIAVPADFTNASDADGLTVQFTAQRPYADLWVKSKNLDRILVNGNGGAEFEYFVNGVGRGSAEFKVIRNNRHFVPNGCIAACAHKSLSGKRLGLRVALGRHLKPLYWEIVTDLRCGSCVSC